MKKLTLSLAALTLVALATPAFADFIPYGNVGNVAPTTTYTATGSSIDLYFYGYSAADTDYIEVFDVTAGTNSGQIFENKTTTPGSGSEIVFATNPGDTLVFDLYNSTTNQTFSSNPADSVDGYNHAYATPYSGPSSNAAVDNIPAGTFVGFEDLYIAAYPSGHCGATGDQSDCDYNDDQFVFVGINGQSTPPVPEPGSLALLGTGILGAAGVIRRRLASR